MTTGPESRFEHDPALAAVHEAVLADEVDDEVDDVDDDSEAHGAALAGVLTSEMFASEVRAYVDEALRPGQPPAPTLQHRMSDTARRVLRKRRLPLPVLLADARITQQVPAADVTAAVGIDEAGLRDLEFGNAEIRTLSAEQVAAWSQVVKLDATETVVGLRNTLTSRTAAPSQVAAGADAETVPARSDEEFVAEVARLLGL